MSTSELPFGKSIKKRLKYVVPVGMKKALKYSFYSFQDLSDFIKGNKSEYPPKRLNFVGSAAFKKVGDEFFEYFKKYANLVPEDHVLDIGCGIGRMAIPLTKYLKAEDKGASEANAISGGRYEGFDIDKRGVDWCHKNLTPKYPHFRFQYVDLFNKYYNKKGKIAPLEFKFPYPDDSFTFAFATSVFTHMLPADVVHYLKESNRVLKKGGRALITFFSIDEAARANMQNGLSPCNFQFANDENSFYSHKNMREAEIGFLKNWILNQIKNYGFILERIIPGTWSGNKDGVSYQDIFILIK